MDLLSLVVVVVAGLLAGAVNSIAGGGSLLLFPALLGVGLPTLTANVTNTVANCPGFLGQVWGFAPELRKQPKHRMIVLSIATGIGTVIGSILLLSTSTAAFNMVVPGLVLFATALLAAQRRLRKLAKTTEPRNGSPLQAAILPLVLLAAGIYGGYFGGALGVIILVALAMTTAEDLRQLNALKAALSLVDSLISVAIFATWGPVNWTAVLAAAPSSLAGGYLGARIARWMNEEALRWSVVTIGCTVSIYLMIA
ncbi:sulfite exporter TauE/SafE family protein [Actinokineospora enzanensis]|uniref:sulfite exporter TauE/SafE family protein n=1 Tax=Actinokineospora enzanensis TaxID=155975 RepID=UPI0003749EB5|nr:sulfite exporter TauE/SafE family protein [Actinokineospora enzanensis]